MAKINGTPINFGIPNLNITGLTGKFQEANHGIETDNVNAKDENGDVFVDVFPDKRRTGEIVFVVTGASVAAAQAATTLENIPPGTFVAITSADGRPDLVRNDWVITEAGPKTEGDNTGIARIRIPIRQRDNIQPPSIQ